MLDAYKRRPFTRCIQIGSLLLSSSLMNFPDSRQDTRLYHHPSVEGVPCFGLREIYSLPTWALLADQAIVVEPSPCHCYHCSLGAWLRTRRLVTSMVFSIHLFLSIHAYRFRLRCSKMT